MLRRLVNNELDILYWKICADKSLVRPGKKQARATEDFLVHTYILFIETWGGVVVKALRY
jgi:hypothetical protein